MKKTIHTVILTIILLIGVAACSELPDTPSSDEVLRDVEVLVSDTFIGEVEGTEENFLISDLIIEEMEIEWVREEEKLIAEIIAFVGDQEWKSEEKQTIKVHYTLNASKQWEADGVSVNNPIIRVIQR